MMRTKRLPLFSSFQWGAKILFAMVVISHLSLIHLIVVGNLYQILICVFAYFVTGCLGMSMTYHRLLSHGSWSPPRWMEGLGTFFGTIGLTGSSIAWCAVHKAHHHSVDTQRDPHSPLFKGFCKAHFLSMFETPRLYYARDLIRDPLHRNFHKYYLLINLSWAVGLYCIDPYAVVYAYLAPAAILWNGGSSINSFCHLWGYKNFQTKDNARNNMLFGFLTWGEGWHNNHHQYPMRSSFKVKPWELDVGGWIINVFQKIEPSIGKKRLRR